MGIEIGDIVVVVGASAETFSVIGFGTDNTVICRGQNGKDVQIDAIHLLVVQAKTRTVQDAIVDHAKKVSEALKNASKIEETANRKYAEYIASIEVQITEFEEILYQADTAIFLAKLALDYAKASSTIKNSSTNIMIASAQATYDSAFAEHERISSIVNTLKAQSSAKFGSLRL